MYATLKQSLNAHRIIVTVAQLDFWGGGRARALEWPKIRVYTVDITIHPKLAAATSRLILATRSSEHVCVYTLDDNYSMLHVFKMRVCTF